MGRRPLVTRSMAKVAQMAASQAPAQVQVQVQAAQDRLVLVCPRLISWLCWAEGTLCMPPASELLVAADWWGCVLLFVVLQWLRQGYDGEAQGDWRRVRDEGVAQERPCGSQAGAAHHGRARHSIGAATPLHCGPQVCFPGTELCSLLVPVLLPLPHALLFMPCHPPVRALPSCTW